jgi:hypothetical protein
MGHRADSPSRIDKAPGERARGHLREREQGAKSIGRRSLSASEQGERVRQHGEKPFPSLATHQLTHIQHSAMALREQPRLVHRRPGSHADPCSGLPKTSSSAATAISAPHPLEYQHQHPHGDHGELLRRDGDQRPSPARIPTPAPSRQGCHKGRNWTKITIRTSFSSGRPRTSSGRPRASAFTPRTRFYPRTGFYRPRTQPSVRADARVRPRGNKRVHADAEKKLNK